MRSHFANHGLPKLRRLRVARCVVVATRNIVPQRGAIRGLAEACAHSSLARADRDLDARLVQSGHVHTVRRIAHSSARREHIILFIAEITIILRPPARPSRLYVSRSTDTVRLPRRPTTHSRLRRQRGSIRVNHRHQGPRATATSKSQGVRAAPSSRRSATRRRERRHAGLDRSRRIGIGGHLARRLKRPTTKCIRPVSRKRRPTHRLSEEVGAVGRALDQHHTQMLLVNVIAHKIPATVDVASACRRCAVHSKKPRPAAIRGDGDHTKSEAHLLEHLNTRQEVAHPRAKAIQLRLRGRQRRLHLAPPGHSSTRKHEHPARDRALNAVICVNHQMWQPRAIHRRQRGRNH